MLHGPQKKPGSAALRGSSAGASEGSAAPSRRRFVIIIPAFNEQSSLPQTLSELLTVLRQHPGTLGSCEIVVVDDGSTDGTRSVALSCGVVVLSHACNLGYGAAVSTGLQYAVSRDADAVAVLDADGQHDPGALLALLTPIIEGKADLAIGSRFMSAAPYRMGFARRVGAFVFGRVLSALARQPIRDTTSGYQCMSRRALALLARDYPTDYPDAQVILQLVLSGVAVVEIPVPMRPRTAGRSMHSLGSVFRYPMRMVLSMLVVMLRWGLRRIRASSHT